MSQPLERSPVFDHRPVEPFVDVAIRIETPENVLLDYQLAGPGARCAAYAIDLLVRSAAMWAIIAFLSVFAIVLPGMSMGMIFLVWSLNQWFYYTISETFFHGKSIGKHTFGLRVIHDKGYPITFWQALLRNLFRVPDSFMLYGVGFVTMLLSRRFKRLGDLAARTIVVTERRVVLPREPIILEKIDPLLRSELGGYVPPQSTLAMIDEFLGRRFVLTHERGHALALPLAQALAKRLSFQGDRRLVTHYPMAFLARVYVTFLREREEDDDGRGSAFQPQQRARPVAGGRR